MANRTRNLVIIGLVLALLTGALLLIIPGSPLNKPTRLGLDLKGGVELVYEGRPTPKVPEVTPQAIDDALETIRKRTDALGVSEPEIQRAGADQISIGLPDVKNAERAIEQVGTTAQLQFYDWEPNVRGRGPDQPYSGSTALFQAVEAASRAKPKAEAVDLPPGGAEEKVTQRFGGDQQKIRASSDRANDTSKDKYYLFGPDKKLVAGPDTTCAEVLADFERRPGAAAGGPRKVPKGSECRRQLAALGASGPPAGSQVLKVLQGIVVVENERQPNQPETLKQFFVLEDDSELSGSDIENPEQNFDQQTQEPIVTMEFTEEGRKAFEQVTKRIAIRGSEQIVPPGAPPDSALQRFAITLDNQIVSLATIDFRENPEGIDGRTGAQINGIGTIEETQDLAENLRIGALPIELKLISQTQISATLGQQALDQGLLAGGAGLALTLLFLVAFYRVLGLVAGLALVIYAVLLFALVKLIPITLTLPGIAGLILTLGVAADANIVIFERIKEEVRSGRSIPASIAGGYAKALRTIIDANVVTIGVAFILFMLATAGVKGFAFTLGVGTLVSLFTAVLATSAILGSMSRTRLLGSRHALGAGEARSRWRFDFIGASRWFFSMSGVILAAGALAIAGLGIKFGIDFESGTRIKTPIEEAASVDEVRDALPAQHRDAKIQEVEEPELGENVFQIATSTLRPAEVQQVEDALDEELGVVRGDFSSSSIGPTFGAQIARTALIAVIASLTLIGLYIALRFEAKFAVPVLIALAHDILITSGVYALTGREVTTSTVAALLTILGYSLYDTIIVFDRIRENVPRMPRATFSQIVNRSMSEVLTRSLATSLCTLLPVTALMLFGGETLRDFAFALLVGIASGAYSSVFIASPVLTLWEEGEPVYRRRRRVVMEDHGGLVPAFAEAALGAPGAAQPASGAPARDRRAPGGPRRPPVAPAPERASDGAEARADAAKAVPGPERAGTEAPKAPAVPSDAGDGVRREQDGAGQSPVTSTTGARSARKQKQRQRRAKKKHGRR
jgi:SecD/SecF fusion protein